MTTYKTLGADRRHQNGHHMDDDLTKPGNKILGFFANVGLWGGIIAVLIFGGWGISQLFALSTP